MLIVPFPEGANWRRPPPVTLALILLNVLVFFAYQSGDGRRIEAIQRTYFSSSLPAIELPLYQQRLEKTKPERARRAATSRPEYLFAAMESDADFMRELRAGEVIAASHPQAGQWRADRERIDRMEQDLSFRRFGFTPADPRPVTWLTNLFLHGDLMHLAGNMVFLFILGVAVEAPLGAGWFLVLYLLAGLAGNAAQFAIDTKSTVPLVGASGAISGLMALFAVVFGLRPVRFFYWLVFVFGFRALRGLAMLPVWIAWELTQYAVDPRSRVGYLAHAGGLVAGAVFGAIVRHRLAGERVERFHQDREGEAAAKADYQRARSLAEKLDYAGANTVFARLAQRIPEDAQMLRQWHAIARRMPASSHFHAVTNLILALPKSDAARRRWQAEVLREYVQACAAAPRLDAKVLARTARAFAQAGQLAEAQAAADMLFKSAPTDPHLPVVWDALAKAFGEATTDAASLEKARRYRSLIAARAKAQAAP